MPTTIVVHMVKRHRAQLSTMLTYVSKRANNGSTTSTHGSKPLPAHYSTGTVCGRTHNYILLRTQLYCIHSSAHNTEQIAARCNGHGNYSCRFPGIHSKKPTSLIVLASTIRYRSRAAATTAEPCGYECHFHGVSLGCSIIQQSD
eukprot:scpid90099/ scgid12304/ 